MDWYFSKASPCHGVYGCIERLSFFPEDPEDEAVEDCTRYAHTWLGHPEVAQLLLVNPDLLSLKIRRAEWTPELSWDCHTMSNVLPDCCLVCDVGEHGRGQKSREDRKLVDFQHLKFICRGCIQLDILKPTNLLRKSLWFYLLPSFYYVQFLHKIS